MATRRRHPRRRQTRRPHQQSGGGREEDFDVIRSVYRYITDPGVMIAAIYNTHELHDSFSVHAPKSQLGGKEARHVVIPDRYTRPEPRMKPLNSVLRCAYNFFDQYAGKSRGDDAEPGEWAMAKDINKKLEIVFWTFVDADPDRRPSRSKIDKADKLFNRIRHYIGAATRSPRAGAGAEEIEDRVKAAERREKERGREARAEMAARAEREAAAAEEAAERAAAAYKAAAAAERYGTNLGTARRNWEYAHRHNRRSSRSSRTSSRSRKSRKSRYSPLPGVWGKPPSSPPM